MLPVVAGRRETKKQILLYTALLVPVSLAPVWLGVSSWVYGAVALALGAVFMAFAIHVWRDPTERRACSHFRYFTCSFCSLS